MYKSIWYIMKKECARFLKDRRMIFTVILLPALLMYGMYTIMGQGLRNAQDVDEEYAFQCYVQNAPGSYEAIFGAYHFDVADIGDVEKAKESVARKEADLVVIFPENFDAQLLNPTGDGSVPNIQVYYNYDKAESRLAYELFLSATEQLETSMVNVLDVNKGVETPNLSSGASELLAFFPALVVMLLFSSCASIAPESIAGEKERGTFATLLVTPVSRTAIAVGKIVSLSVFAVMAGLSNFIGMMLGMRNMLPEDVEGIIPAYGLSEYVWLLLLVVTAVMMTISIISVISAFSNSVKEANSAAAMVTAIASMGSMVTQLSAAASGFGWRCVPVLGTAISLHDIFMMDYSAGDIAITCVSNLLVMFALVFVLSKMFNSEKIMFHKG